MIKPFVDAGLDVHFYPVYWKDGLIQEINLDSDVLFLMDYYGYTGQQTDLSSYKGVIVRDVTHSIFSSTYYDADYYFGSLRKWCGVWSGGYAWTKDGHMLEKGEKDKGEYIKLRSRAMEEKRDYIEGRCAEKKYLKIYDAAEECLETTGIAPADERDVESARRLDVEKIKKQRRANAEVLRKEFSDWLIFPSISDVDTPMFVPVLVPNGKRDALRRYLINNEIYCPIHWPVSEYHRLDEKTAHIYQNELSLVCDQRYTEEDMNRMVESIKGFVER
ncbi:hypothetical protein II898_06585 [bacterium]|nr:hypothetical protein [bacterium]